MTNNPYGPAGPPPPQVEPEPSLVGHPPPVPWQQGASAQLGYRDPSTSAPPQWSGPPPVWAMEKPSPMPDGPREYQQLLRGPRHHWWRPLAALVLALAIAVPLWLVGFLPVIVSGMIVGARNPVQWAFQEIGKTSDLGPAGFLYVTLTLIALIPAAGLSIWIAHRVRPRYLASVRGRIRWRWLLRCLVIVVPVWAVYLGLSIWAEPAATSTRPVSGGSCWSSWCF